MKVVQVNTYDIQGGAARAAYRLYKGLRFIGEDCRLVVRHKLSTDDTVQRINVLINDESYIEDVLLSSVQECYINTHRTNISNTTFSFSYPGCDLSRLPLIRSADIINLHWVAYYQSPITLRKLFALGKPVVWTLHDQWAFTGGCHYSAGCRQYEIACRRCPQLSDDFFDLPAAVLMDKIELFEGADLTIVAPSKWLASCARKSRLFGKLRIEVIPNSLETDIYRPLSKPEAKKRFNIEPETITLLFGADFGNEKRKGFYELIDALHQCAQEPRFKKLADEGRIKIICFGYAGSERELLDIPVISLGYLNTDDELCAAYSAADIFVLPSLEDNLPNTMLEALSCSTPVIAFDIGGIPDVVVEDETGKLSPAHDAKKLGEAIVSLVLDQAKREEMGKKGRVKMANAYSLEIQAKRYLALYKELLF